MGLRRAVITVMPQRVRAERVVAFREHEALIRKKNH